LDKQVFANALSGKPVTVTSFRNITLHGYRIRDMGNFLYVTSTYVDINHYRKVEADTELFWVIIEKLSPLMETKYVIYKTKEIAEEHLKELKDANIN
jgi:hypothetical protein